MRLWPDVVAHTFGPHTQEAESGGFLSSRTARDYVWLKKITLGANVSIWRVSWGKLNIETSKLLSINNSP